MKYKDLKTDLIEVMGGPVSRGLRRVRERPGRNLLNLPPRRLRREISPLWFHFRNSGLDQLEFFIELAGLEPSGRVLDVGCGVGRIAYPLLDYLKDGSYDGFDINTKLIPWCQANITSKYPNFRFHLADVSTTHGPQRASTAAEYRFPYENDSFDLIYAGSVFTHLLQAGAENYLSEVSRVLKPQGRFVSTWLLFNIASTKLVRSRNLEKIWEIDRGVCRTMDDEFPERSVSYEEEYVRGVLKEHGLEIAEPLRADISYTPVRAPARHGAHLASNPKDPELGLHLYYAASIIAVAN